MSELSDKNQMEYDDKLIRQLLEENAALKELGRKANDKELRILNVIAELKAELEAVKNENVQIRDNFQEVFSDNLKLDKELKTQEPVAKIIRNSAGQISMHNMEGDYFDMSKYVGETLYIKAAPMEMK